MVDKNVNACAGRFRSCQVFPLRCMAPIDFEYELIYTQPHPAFIIHPMSGVCVCVLCVCVHACARECTCVMYVCVCVCVCDVCV